MAIGTLLSFCGLLRIGELVGLAVEDVLFAGFDDPRVDFAATSGLRLKRTKTGQNLFAELHNDDVVELLSSLCKGRRPDARVFNFSAGTFRTWFKRAVSALGLDDKYVPHSLRHGAATALYMAGVDIETILVRGRWASTKSARHYIQLGRSLLLAQKVAPDIRDIGKLVATCLCPVFKALQRKCAVIRFSSRARSIMSAMEARKRPPLAPQRHSSRHDFLVRPNYGALDAGAHPVLPR